MDKPPIKVTESRSIPKAIKAYVMWRDGPLCVCGCGEVGKELDHVPAWNLLDPKRHDPDKIFLRGKECHATKSRRDTTDAAKVKRVGKKHRGERPQRFVKAIQSRGFDKSVKRKICSRPWPTK